MEKANENVIQYNIGSTGNGHKIHGSFGITNATEYGADYVISCNKGNSDKTDDKILCGTCHRFCRDTDQYNNGPDEEKKQEEIQNIRNGIGFAKKVLTTGECDLLILDEVLGLVEKDIITVDTLKTLLECRGDTDVILTGITLNDEICVLADEVSKIETVKFKVWD